MTFDQIILLCDFIMNFACALQPLLRLAWSTLPWLTTTASLEDASPGLRGHPKEATSALSSRCNVSSLTSFLYRLFLFACALREKYMSGCLTFWVFSFFEFFELLLIKLFRFHTFRFNLTDKNAYIFGQANDSKRVILTKNFLSVCALCFTSLN